MALPKGSDFDYVSGDVPVVASSQSLAGFDYWPPTHFLGVNAVARGGDFDYVSAGQPVVVSALDVRGFDYWPPTYVISAAEQSAPAGTVYVTATHFGQMMAEESVLFEATGFHTAGPYPTNRTGKARRRLAPFFGLIN